MGRSSSGSGSASGLVWYSSTLSSTETGSKGSSDIVSLMLLLPPHLGSRGSPLGGVPLTCQGVATAVWEAERAARQRGHPSPVNLREARRDDVRFLLLTARGPHVAHPDLPGGSGRRRARPR